MDRKKKKVPGMPTRTRESVQDERFAQVLKNPVFRPVPKKEKKIEIDRRFQGMFNDEKFKLKYKVDKRGRPIATATDENMKRYYNLEEEEEEGDGDDDNGGDGNEQVESADSSSEDEEEEVEGDMKEEKMRFKIPGHKKKIDNLTREKLHSKEVDYARGEADLEDASSSSDDEDDSSEDDGDETEMLEHDWGELDKNAERTDETTRRLALCNMDWDRVRAVDLMVLLSSFLPPGGVIKEVAIYPSEFGKERMAEEEREGPRELRGGEEEDLKIKKEMVDDEDEDDGSGGSGGEDEDDDSEGAQYHREKLRQYQLNRLRYFYAVAEFDSAATAEKVYAECDGMEYESSAAKVDLRFIPDDTSFEEDIPREVCREMPDGQKYRPRFFTTTALQQVKVDLTWDETDPLRRELTEKIFDPKEKVDDDDIRAYLATSSEEEEEEEDEVKKEKSDDEDDKVDEKRDKKQDAISKYKALLESIENGEKKKKEKEVEMEITWGVGLKETTEKLVKKKLEEEEKRKRTPWEEMLDKRKEKRQQRKKEKKKNNGSDDSDSGEADDKPFSDDEVDVDMDDEFFKSEMRENEIFKKSGGGSQTKKKREGKGDVAKEEKGKRKDAELELLLMEDEAEAGKRHFSLKKILEEETDSKSKKKRKWRKNKKKKVEEEEGPSTSKKDDFEIDVEDQRFSALFNSHHFNVDPSDPNFKKTKAMQKIIQEKQKRRADGNEGETITSKHNDDAGGVYLEVAQKKRKLEGKDDALVASKVKKAELSHLVKSVKRNTENLRLIQKEKKKKKGDNFGKLQLKFNN